ncbi:MAG: hypothetical protein QM764_09530 [Chitinophagaceae bacterium]
MKTNLSMPLSEKARNQLHCLVKKIIIKHLPLAVRQHNFFVNDVPTNLFLQTNTQIPAAILNTVIYFSARCCYEAAIKISAHEYSDSLLTKISIRASGDYQNFLSGLQGLMVFAESINGELSISFKDSRQTDISFSFLNRRIHCLLKEVVCKEDMNFIKYLKAS